MIRRLAIFPLGRAILFPRAFLPLHIFEPRYRAMINDIMARDQCIGMIQPNGTGEDAPLFDMGCIGKVTEIQAHEDGHFDIVLTGQSRFRIIRELETETPFRQVKAELIDNLSDDPAFLAASERAALEMESRSYAGRLGYDVDWESVIRLDDEMLVNSIAQVAPFDAAAKQALLEADLLTDRSELLIQLMQFAGRDEGGGSPTLQ